MRAIAEPKDLRVLVGPTGGSAESVGRAMKRCCDAITFTYEGSADLVIDPQRQVFLDLLTRLPKGWEPDAVVQLGACHNCVPIGMEVGSLPAGRQRRRLGPQPGETAASGLGL